MEVFRKADSQPLAVFSVDGVGSCFFFFFSFIPQSRYHSSIVKYHNIPGIDGVFISI